MLRTDTHTEWGNRQDGGCTPTHAHTHTHTHRRLLLLRRWCFGACAVRLGGGSPGSSPCRRGPQGVSDRQDLPEQTHTVLQSHGCPHHTWPRLQRRVTRVSTETTNDYYSYRGPCRQPWGWARRHPPVSGPGATTRHRERRTMSRIPSRSRRDGPHLHGNKQPARDVLSTSKSVTSRS